MIAIAPASRAWCLGIDTSAYTTSIAAVASQEVLHQERQILPVAQGSRGLRPSDAVFHHVRNLSDMVATLFMRVNPKDLAQVAVSVTPRPRPDSYLPAFVAGETVAHAIAATSGVPLLRTSHQEGHIRAAIAGSGFGPKGAFWALHLSGGTTELLRVVPRASGWDITPVGGSDDLYAGQLIDRIGVMLGCSFPAGPELDRLAESADSAYRISWGAPRQHDGQWWISFSGPETHAERALAKGVPGAAVARGVFEALSLSLAALVSRVDGDGDLLVAGGVAANIHLRRRFRELLEPQWRLWFADPEWSRDNAIGVAWLGYDEWRRRSQ